MWHLLALSLLAASASAATIRVETANTDWSYLPLLEHRGYDHLKPRIMQRIFELANDGDCDLAGQSRNRIDIRLSFAAQFTNDGKLVRLILPRLNCPEGEGVIGGALLQMIQRGDYRPTGKNPDGWYRGNLSFAYSDAG